MPAHSSHILQPLDVSCFGPLKKAYGRQIERLIRAQINHISKLEFFPAFKQAFQDTFSYLNITSGFRSTGIVPFNPGVVISKLDIHIRTPSPPVATTTTTTAWDAKTPSNATELALQSTLLKERVRRHQDSSPTPINEAL